MNNARMSRAAAIAAIVVVALTFGLSTYAGGNATNDPTVFHDAVGSWFGRAVPVPGETICPPGVPGCPVPSEIVMIFTVNADGNFIGIDSNIFAGGDHTTAHGQWVRDGHLGIKAEFTLLQSSPDGVFIGGFKNLFNATLIHRDEMRGSIDARLYNYTDPTGAAIVDAEGFPTPSPLAPASECATTAGCTHLGKFSFLVRRAKVN
jgi:hypothetical protein